VGAAFGFGAGLIIAGTANRAQQAVAVPPTAVLRFLRENEPVPDFTLVTLDGRTVRLGDLRGKPVLINFWASWCPPCLRETPALVEAYKELKESGAVFVGIGTQDDTANLKKFVDDNQVPYTVVEDPLGKVSGQYRVLGMPTTFIVDQDGLLRKVFNGEVQKEQVIEAMRGLLP
jgi:peroxiredoxin